jgi:hypothetical protein
MLHQPWRYSTGPRTAAGRAQVARQRGDVSRIELRQETNAVFSLFASIFMDTEARDRRIDPPSVS